MSKRSILFINTGEGCPDGDYDRACYVIADSKIKDKDVATLEAYLIEVYGEGELDRYDLEMAAINKLREMGYKVPESVTRHILEVSP